MDATGQKTIYVDMAAEFEAMEAARYSGYTWAEYLVLPGSYEYSLNGESKARVVAYYRVSINFHARHREVSYKK